MRNSKKITAFACLLCFIPGFFTVYLHAEPALIPENPVQPVYSSTQPGPCEDPLDSVQSSVSFSLQDEQSSPLSPSTIAQNSFPVQALDGGRSFYVSVTGSDQADGTESSPWQTIQYGISNLQAGDTLYISGGTYSESLQIQSSGAAGAFITMEGLGNVIIDGADLGTGKNGIDTNGFDFLRFQNLTINHFSGAGIQLDSGSNSIEIDGFRADGNTYAVRMDTATNVSVRNAWAVNSNNAFRVFGASRGLLFENIETRNSRDVFPGMNPDYLNGDGFILESNVSSVVFRNIVSANNWDAGFDIKASDVLIENAVAYGNKNNFKTWGNNITIRSSLSYGALRQIRSDGTTVEGNGITVVDGSTFAVNMTFADNEDHEIQVYSGAKLDLRDSIVARRNITGLLLENKGTFFTDRVLWYNSGLPKPDFRIGTMDFWADPKFLDWSRKDYHLSAESPALDFGRVAETSGKDVESKPRIVGPAADLGAYEIQTLVPSKFKGIASGAIVTGKVFIYPDPVYWPQVKSVVYFIDGRKITSTSSKPYTMGGSAGYLTSKLLDGAHVLTIVVEISKNVKVQSSIAFISDQSPGTSTLSVPKSKSKKS